jgi:flagellar FliJ protein
MAKPFPLQTLLDHSRHRMDAAERLLRILKRKEDDARARLEEFHGYKRDYQHRLAGAGGRGMEIHLLRDFHVFLHKLDAAIAQQEGEVNKAHGHWQDAHVQWLALRQKVKAYETLARRHETRELASLEKREQRLSDENALRRHLVRGGKLGQG